MMTGALSDIFQSIEQSQGLIYAIWRHCRFQFYLAPILRRVPFGPRSTSFISSSQSTLVNNRVNSAHQHANDQVLPPLLSSTCMKSHYTDQSVPGTRATAGLLELVLGSTRWKRTLWLQILQKVDFVQDEPSEPFHLISKGYFLWISLLRFTSNFFLPPFVIMVSGKCMLRYWPLRKWTKDSKTYCTLMLLIAYLKEKQLLEAVLYAIASILVACILAP